MVADQSVSDTEFKDLKPTAAYTERTLGKTVDKRMAKGGSMVGRMIG
jgi:hypothetical protein